MIQKCVEKKLDKQLLLRFTAPEQRNLLLNVIETGNYFVAPPHIEFIPKDDGTFRKVYANEQMDRIVLSLINEVYFILYGNRIHKRCMSYQKKLGVNTVIKDVTYKIRNGYIGYKVDLSKYFDSVNKQTLYDALDSLDTGSPIDKIVQDYYRSDIVWNESHTEYEEKYKSLAQGCAVSAFLANYILRDIDKEMSGMCSLYYRYSDDIIFFANNPDEKLEYLQELLATKGLKINPKKIEKISGGEAFTFLGCEIHGNSIRFSKKSKRKFEIEINKRVKATKSTKNSVRQLKKAIMRVNEYLYTGYIKSRYNYGWGEKYFSVINDVEQFEILDQWLKDKLRTVYTGRTKCGTVASRFAGQTSRHVSKNKEKVSNEMLEELGYVSMVHLYKLYRSNPEVYRQEVRIKMM